MSSMTHVSKIFALLGLGVMLTAGCEDKAIGRACDVQAPPDGGTNKAIFNAQALECPSRICLRPAKESTVAMSVDTSPVCTAECSKDKDCSDGETRNPGNKDDKRCKGGWVCAVPFVTGDLCCKKLCMCKDFLPTVPDKDGPPVCDPKHPVNQPVAQCKNVK